MRVYREYDCPLYKKRRMCYIGYRFMSGGGARVYRVAICDDVERDLEQMTGLAVSLLKEERVECAVDRFHAARELLRAKRLGGSWDLILLDIMMDEQDGIELADALREAGDETDLVFITASPEYALAGYRSYPVSYLMKPLTRDALRPVLRRCLEAHRRVPTLTLDAMEGGKAAFPLRDISFIEVFRRELVVHCGADRVSCAGSLSAALERLPGECFYRCHRSFVVNLAYVNGIRKYCFLLRSGGTVPVAMREYPEAQKRWLAYVETE